MESEKVKVIKVIDIDTLLKIINCQIALVETFRDISYSSDINNAYFDGYIIGLKKFKKRIEKLK